MAVTAKDYKGEHAPDNGTYAHEDSHGNQHEVPKGIDFGWDYAPGSSNAAAARDKFVADKAGQLPEQIADDFTDDVTYWPQGTTQAPWHNAGFSGAQYWMNDAIKRHDPQFTGVTQQGESAYFSPPDKTINMGSHATDNYHSQGTWRHEYGHYLDYEMQEGFEFRSSADDFKRTLKDDTKEILNASGRGRQGKASDARDEQRYQRYTEIKNDMAGMNQGDIDVYLSDRATEIGLSIDDIDVFFASETALEDLADNLTKAKLLQAIMDRDAANFMQAITSNTNHRLNADTYKLGLVGKFSDLVGSATRNKLLGHGVNGLGGHSNGYYKKSGNAETEVFANLTALLGANSRFWTVVTESFYPNLTKLFKNIMKND